MKMWKLVFVSLFLIANGSTFGAGVDAPAIPTTAPGHGVEDSAEAAGAALAEATGPAHAGKAVEAEAARPDRRQEGEAAREDKRKKLDELVDACDPSRHEAKSFLNGK